MAFFPNPREDQGKEIALRHQVREHHVLKGTLDVMGDHSFESYIVRMECSAV